MSLHGTVSTYWFTFQQSLFPWLNEELGALSERHRQFVQVLEFARVESLLACSAGRGPGRPAFSRAALARAFLAKAVFDLPTPRALVERLRCDAQLRQLCGWERAEQLPSAAKFSRAFAGFAHNEVASALHAAIVERTLGEHLAESERKRLERQPGMSLGEMLQDLPTVCNTGAKRNAKGYKETWNGYKLHIDAIDGGIPVSCLLTSASVHDSQVAIPLAHLTAGRIENLYDLMDSSHDAEAIREYSRGRGPVPIIAINPRRDAQKKAELQREALAQRSIGQVPPQTRRYRDQSTVERSNGRLKDEFGGRHVRVRGHRKVLCHLMFGIIALTVDQLMRLPF